MFGSSIVSAYIYSMQNETNNNMTTSSDYKVKGFNNNTLFAVVSGNDIHSNYYKTEKAANKMLLKVRAWAGE